MAVSFFENDRDIYAIHLESALYAGLIDEPDNQPLQAKRRCRAFSLQVYALRVVDLLEDGKGHADGNSVA